MATRKNIKQQFTLPDSNLVLVGIVSALKENSLVMLLNGWQSFNFYQPEPSSTETVPLPADKLAFTIFLSEDEATETLFTLLVNRTALGVYSKAFKEFDFLVQIEGELAEKQAKHLIDFLKHTPDILIAGVLPMQKLKGQRISV